MCQNFRVYHCNHDTQILSMFHQQNEVTHAPLSLHHLHHNTHIYHNVASKNKQLRLYMVISHLVGVSYQSQIYYTWIELHHTK